MSERDLQLCSGPEAGMRGRLDAWTDDYASIVPLLRWWQGGKRRPGMETTMRRHQEVH